MIKNVSIIARSTWILFTCLLISCDNKKEALPLNVIPLANAVGKYDILNLSDYVTEIKYIPLETNDSVLIGEIRQISYENEKIFVSDHTRNCGYLFDNEGKFRCKIGKRGQGPNEHLFINQAFIHENLIYLRDAIKILIYDTNGSLVDNINMRPDDMPAEYRIPSVLPLKKDTFVMDVVVMNGYYPKALLVEMYQSKAKTIKEYPSHIKLDKSYSFYSNLEMAIMYRFNEDIRTYKSINDTIFSISHDMEMKDAFIFDLGKYRPSLSFLEGKERATGNDITPVKIFESPNHVFIEFSFGINNAPEPFEKTPEIDSSRKIWIEARVFSVFDKRTGELKLMKQPIKEKLGFKNDIDNGPIIWPHYMSSNNELVTYISVEEFMDYYEKIANPSPQMTEIARNVKIDDNQIVIIAKLNIQI